MIAFLPFSRRVMFFLALAALTAVASPSARAGEPVLLEIAGAPADKPIVCPVDLTEAAREAGWNLTPGTALRAVDEQGNPLPMQWVPDVQADPPERLAGNVVLRLPAVGEAVVRLEPIDASSEQPAPQAEQPVTIETAFYTITHDPKQQGGLPSAIVFAKTGKRFDTFRWGDRLHSKQLGGFSLAGDQQPRVRIVSQGPLCTVVRVEAVYTQGDRRPDSQPRAVYDWYYFADSPKVVVTARVQQNEAFAWDELHFLELNYPDESFVRWAGGEPPAGGELAGSNESHSAADWAALYDEQNAIGMYACGTPIVYDGRGGYGTYLHADSGTAWGGWRDREKVWSGRVWIGSDDAPVAAVAQAAKEPIGSATVEVTLGSLRDALAGLTDQAAATSDPAVKRPLQQRRATAEAFLRRGRYAAVRQTLQNEPVADLYALPAGGLCLLVDASTPAAPIVDLLDTDRGRVLTAEEAAPLIELTLRHAATGREQIVTSAGGFQEVSVVPSEDGKRLTLTWQKPVATDLPASLRMTATAEAWSDRGVISWTLAADGADQAWSIWRAVYPQITLRAEPDGPSTLLFPRGSGELSRDVCGRAFQWKSDYPGGWTGMQFMAFYGEASRRGLYVALHDPWGDTKDIAARSRPERQSITLGFDVPAADMSRPGNTFTSDGSAVWQQLQGDWFDAAMIYRDWVEREARWYPKLSPAEGRTDTPLWMRQLPAWALTGGTADECVPRVERFAQWLGVPIGFHWYSWHETPFDNNYPHYFPAREGFAEGVARLQKNGVHVMPYINGRLWDTHDRDTEDWQFSATAQPAATKNVDGSVHTETYGSKESDGSSVVLGVMCPTTAVWRVKQTEIIDRLMNECGVDGVYMDQIAAATPVLCFDASHGHLLGGGHWWTEGYWGLLDQVRGKVPPEKMLTTECNAEPFLRWFDGYLTWHWQYDDQVPVFPAVYGGAIQMFGRAYRGGETQNLALRMKSAQQLCYGEQIGWLDPGVMDEPENAEFFRRVVRLRYQLGEYFYAGRMRRPPAPTGTIPTVRADWQWSGVWWVENPALETATWQRGRDGRVLMLLANTSDEPIATQLQFDAGEWGWNAKPESIQAEPVVLPTLPDQTETAPVEQPSPLGPLTIPPRTVWAWEVSDNS